MKRKSRKTYAIYFLSLAGIYLTMIFSCQKTEEVQPLIDSNLNNYDQVVTDLALAVSQTLNAVPDFRRIIKHEALKQIDGDYDVILRHIANKKLSDYNLLLKKSASDIRIKDLLAEHMGSATGKKSVSSDIDRILRDNPELQISVPVHCDEWNPESYVPDVAILDRNYYDNDPATVRAYNSDGEPVELSAVEEPAEPVVVIGLNERMVETSFLPKAEATRPEAPTSLTGVPTESGIRLSWRMSSECNSLNTSGYYIYRKGVYESSYKKIATVNGCYTRSYDDNTVEPSRSYSYYVSAYYGSFNSDASNYISVKAPANPKPVESFDVMQISGSRVELRWQNDYSQSFNSTEIYRFRQGIDSDYRFFGTFDPSGHYCFDTQLAPGRKYTYKIHHRSDMGLSNPKYDLVKIPYRDIANPSPVYIQGIRFHDWKIERWLAGKPEFFVTVGNVNLSTGKTYAIQEKIFLEFESRKSTHLFPDVLVFKWLPGIWYDMLTFSMVEHDAGGSLEIKFSAGFNSKSIEKMSMLPVSFGAEYTYKVGNGSENCGCSYLNYYDNPDCWLLFPNYGAELLVSEKTFNEIQQTELVK